MRSAPRLGLPPSATFPHLPARVRRGIPRRNTSPCASICTPPRHPDPGRCPLACCRLVYLAPTPANLKRWCVTFRHLPPPSRVRRGIPRRDRCLRVLLFAHLRATPSHPGRCPLACCRLVYLAPTPANLKRWCITFCHLPPPSRVRRGISRRYASVCFTSTACVWPASWHCSRVCSSFKSGTTHIMCQAHGAVFRT
jgi:hypothetical protein